MGRRALFGSFRVAVSTARLLDYKGRSLSEVVSSLKGGEAYSLSCDNLIAEDNKGGRGGDIWRLWGKCVLMLLLSSLQCRSALSSLLYVSRPAGRISRTFLNIKGSPKAPPPPPPLPRPDETEKEREKGKLRTCVITSPSPCRHFMWRI